MRVKQVTQHITTEVFISDNGLKFESKEDCLAYEQKRTNILNRIAQIKNFYKTPDVLDKEEYEWRWYYITSQEDINALLTYYNEFCNLYNNITIPDFTVPTWIYIQEKTSSGEDEAYTGFTLQEFKTAFQNVLKELEE